MVENQNVTPNNQVANYSMEEVPTLLRYFYKGKKTEAEIQQIIQTHGEALVTNPKFIGVLSKVKDTTEALPPPDEIDIKPEEVYGLLNTFYKGTKTPQEIKEIIKVNGESLLSDPKKLMMLMKIKNQALQERNNISYPEPTPPPVVPVQEEIEPEPVQQPLPPEITPPKPIPNPDPAPEVIPPKPKEVAPTPLPTPQPLPEPTALVSQPKPEPTPDPMPKQSPKYEFVSSQPAVEQPYSEAPKSQTLSDILNRPQIVEEDTPFIPTKPSEEQVLSPVARRTVLERDALPVSSKPSFGELLNNLKDRPRVNENSIQPVPLAPDEENILKPLPTKRPSIMEKDLRGRKLIPAIRPTPIAPKPLTPKPTPTPVLPKITNRVHSDKENIANYVASIGIKDKKGKALYGSILANLMRTNYDKMIEDYPEIKVMVDRFKSNHKKEEYSLLRGIPAYTEQFGKSLKAKPNLKKVLKTYPSIAKGYKKLKGVDETHIFDNEGGVYLTGYVPNYYSKRRKKNIVIGRSGVTIGAGIDLGSTKESELISYGLSAEGVAKLKPYLGLTRDKAFNKLKEAPLEISFEDAMKVTLGKASMLVRRAESVVNARKGKKFDTFDPKVKTMMFDLVYQGLNRTNSKILNYLADENYAGALAQLRKAELIGAGGTGSRYRERRQYIEPTLMQLMKAKKKD